MVQNMPGGGSMIAANFLYGVAKPDGLTIASINPALYFNQLAGRKEVQFDWAKFHWLGSPDWSDHVLYMRTDAPYKTIHDVRTASTPPKCTTGHYLPKLLEETIGTKFNIILGYPGGPEMDLAVERNEAQCRAFTTTAWFSGEPYESWRKNGFARLLIQTGRKQDERLSGVPTLYELMDQYKTAEVERRLADVVLASNIFGRPYVAAPGMAPDQVKILREAFAKTMSDPEFLAEAKRRNLEIKPTAASELEKLAKAIVVQPPEVIERMKKLLGK
jgi:tripartite-type tricarboxylate transporter receptor subunit TctC